MKSLGHNTHKSLIRDQFVFLDDPYIRVPNNKLALQILQYKTGVVEDTTDPEFNEEFSFNLSRWIGSIETRRKTLMQPISGRRPWAKFSD